MPFTTPAVTEVCRPLLLQVPLPLLAESVIDEPAHTVDGPERLAGVGVVITMIG